LALAKEAIRRRRGPIADGELLSFAVAPTLRGAQSRLASRRIADILVDEALARLAAAGARTIQMLVEPGNLRACRFFESIGASLVPDSPRPISKRYLLKLQNA
jgi:ribosomal protein S18 acetylase RimI-like enzyme